MNDFFDQQRGALVRDVAGVSDADAHHADIIRESIDGTTGM